MGFFEWIIGRAGKKESTQKVTSEEGTVWKVKNYPDGSFYVECGVGEPFKTFFRLSEIIDKSKAIEERLAACEATYKILPQFVRAWLKDSERLPDTILCRDVGIELYLRLGRWEEARNAIEKCAVAGVYDDDGKAAIEHFQKYKEAAETALKFLTLNPGYLQKNIYRALPDVDQECLKKFTRSSMLIRKEKSGGTNKLYVA